MAPIKASASSPFRDFARKMWDKFNAPKPYLDSAWIFQPKSSWDVSVSYKGYWNGIKFAIPMEFQTGRQATMNMALADHVTHNIGLYGGYGPINLGYSMSLGKTPGEVDRKFSFDWLCPHYGAQFYYAGFGQKTVNITFDNVDDVNLDMNYPSTINLLRADAYYAFNRSRFSYPAAYKGKMIQKKSAGSVVASVKYQHTGITMNIEEERPEYALLRNGRLAVNQLSLGLGYSFNFVPYHRNARGAADLRDLRNMTFNLTVIPQLAFLNEMMLTSFQEGTDGSYAIHGRLQPNLLGKFAFCYTIGHVYIVARFEYHLNMIRSGELTIPGNLYKMSMNGNMSSWAGGFDIHYRF